MESRLEYNFRMIQAEGSGIPTKFRRENSSTNHYILFIYIKISDHSREEPSLPLGTSKYMIRDARQRKNHPRRGKKSVANSHSSSSLIFFFLSMLIWWLN